MIHRHPHVFADHPPFSSPTAEDWEKLKRSETGKKSVTESLDDVSAALPSLKYASKMLKKCALLPSCRRGTEEILAEIENLVSDLKISVMPPDEAVPGKLLLLVAEFCFSLNMDGELLLHRSVENLKKRIQAENKEH